MGKWTRRGVLSAGVLGGTGLVIGIAVRPGNPTETVGHLVAGEGENLLHIYLKIDSENRATAILPHSEMGQGAQTALTQMLAEEMDADWDNIHIRQAIASPMYGNPNKEGRQTIGNSDSIIGYYEVLRKIGAAARYMLIEAAAKNMNTAKEDLIIEKSIIFDKNTGENRSFGELVDIAASLDLPTDFPLKEKSDSP